MTKKNGETRHQTKKMGRPDIRQKKWRDETQDKKNGETIRETKKGENEKRDKKKMER